MRIPRDRTIQGPPLLVQARPKPGAPLPTVSGTTLAPVPTTYPAGPTELGFLYGQLQGVAFPGSPNTWTQPQTLSLTDAGGGLDRSGLRPPMLILQHQTAAATVAGTGTSIISMVPDVAGTLVRLSKQVTEITTTVAGIVDSTYGFCVQSGGTEIEVARVKGAHGLTPLLDPNGSLAGDAASAFPGYVGGAFAVRGQLQMQGMQAATNSVNRNALAISATTGAVGAVGLGWGLDVQLQDAGGHLVDTAYLDCALTDATNNATTAEWRLWGSYQGTNTQLAFLNGSGELGLTGGQPLLGIKAAPAATASYGLVNLGNGGFSGGAGGFAGNVNGGFLCINAANGSAARLIDCQAAGVAKFQVNSAGNLTFTGSFAHQGTAVGFYGASPNSKQNITGSRAGNAALALLLTGLAAIGLITDSTTA